MESSGTAVDVRVDLQVRPVVPGVWCLRRRSYLSCSYIVSRGKETVLIDAGMSSSGSDVFRGLAAAGLARESITSVLVTHWHNDHTGGAGAVQSQTGAPISCHTEEAPYMTGATTRTGLRGWLGDRVPEWGPMVLLKGLLGESTPRPVESVRHVHDGERLECGLEVVATPGHTAGHVSYFLPEQRVLFAGDALAVVGNKLALMSRPVTPDLARARESARRLVSIDADAICPGHRRPLADDCEPERQRLRAFLDSNAPWPLWGTFA